MTPEAYRSAVLTAVAKAVAAVPLPDEVETEPEIVERGVVHWPCVAVLEFHGGGVSEFAELRGLDGQPMAVLDVQICWKVLDRMSKWYRAHVDAFERSLVDAEADRRRDELRDA